MKTGLGCSLAFYLVSTPQTQQSETKQRRKTCKHRDGKDGRVFESVALASRYLRGLLQVQPGLSDDPLGVLQLSLELAVFSGHLLKHLTHNSDCK